MQSEVNFPPLFPHNWGLHKVIDVFASYCYYILIVPRNIGQKRAVSSAGRAAPF